jgi:hypothetical protein
VKSGESDQKAAVFVSLYMGTGFASVPEALEVVTLCSDRVLEVALSRPLLQLLGWVVTTALCEAAVRKWSCRAFLGDQHRHDYQALSDHARLRSELMGLRYAADGEAQEARIWRERHRTLHFADEKLGEQANSDWVVHQDLRRLGEV